MLCLLRTDTCGFGASLYLKNTVGSWDMFFLAGAFLAVLFLCLRKLCHPLLFFILLIAVALLSLASGPIIGLLVGIWVAADIPRKKPFKEESFPMYLVPGVLWRRCERRVASYQFLPLPRVLPLTSLLIAKTWTDRVPSLMCSFSGSVLYVGVDVCCWAEKGVWKHWGGFPFQHGYIQHMHYCWTRSLGKVDFLHIFFFSATFTSPGNCPYSWSIQKLEILGHLFRPVTRGLWSETQVSIMLVNSNE